MRFSAALLAFVPALVSARNITVQVGGGGLNFNPTTIQADVDDLIIFQFVAKTHSVTQSTFAAPCVKSPEGIDSGVKTVTEGAASIEQWGFKVQSTDPLWFYCQVGQHCQNGMVFSVNPTAEKTHEAFLAAAQAGGGAGNSTSPSGSAAPSGGSTPSGGAEPPAIPSASGVPPAANRPSGSASAAASEPSNGALHLAGNAAGILTMLGLMAGLIL